MKTPALPKVRTSSEPKVMKGMNRAPKQAASKLETTSTPFQPHATKSKDFDEAVARLQQLSNKLEAAFGSKTASTEEGATSNASDPRVIPYHPEMLNLANVAGEEWIRQQGVGLSTADFRDRNLLATCAGAVLRPEDFTHPTLDLLAFARLGELGWKPRVENIEVVRDCLASLLPGGLLEKAAAVRFARAFPQLSGLALTPKVAAARAEIDAHNAALAPSKPEPTPDRPEDTSRVCKALELLDTDLAQAAKAAAEVARSLWSDGREPEKSFRTQLGEAVQAELAQRVPALQSKLESLFPGAADDLSMLLEERCSFRSLKPWIDAEVMRHETEQLLSNTKAEFQKDALAQTQADWSADSATPFGERLESSLRKLLEDRLPRICFEVSERLLGLEPAVVEQLLSPDSMRNWIDTQIPDLSYGEKILTPAVPAGVEVSEGKLTLISKLASLGNVGDAADLALLQQVLACVDEELLRELVSASYSIVVARDNITNGNLRASGRKLAGGFTVDHADGVHAVEAGGDRSITIRSFMRDGKLVFNVSTLMHEIGHAIDMVLRAKGKDPLHVNKAFADAFAGEHQNFSRSYFHTQPEFMAEAFARYSMDPEQTRRKFPLATKAFESLKLASPVVDGQALVALHHQMVSEAPVTTSVDAVAVLDEHFKLNRARAQHQKTLEPLILDLAGESAATEALAKQLGSHWVTLRAPTVSPFGVNDGFVPVDAATFNDPTAFQSLLDELTGGNGAVLYLSDLSGIARGSPGFARLKQFQQLTGDLCPVVIAGGTAECELFHSSMGAVLRQEVKVAPLSAEQIAELVRREVNNDGYELSQEAAEALVSRTRGGDYQAAMALWKGIKQVQQDRKVAISAEVQRQSGTVGWVLARDVDGAKVAAKKDPLGALNQLIGLSKVKTEIRRLISAQTLGAQREKLGLKATERRRLNLLFSGNPGTGKTTVARLFAELALEHGLSKRSGVAIVSAAELAKAGPAKLLELFRTNRDGVIFIDEFHQLADPETSGGKAILNALVPLLTDPEYADTIFIGAGYPDKLRLLMDADEGLRRRFTDIPFEDYSKAELSEIVEKALPSRELIAADEVKAAMLQRVVSMQRAAKYPGNAGDVMKVLDEVGDRQQARLGDAPDVASLDAVQLQTVELADVVVPPRYSVDEVMGEIMALEGLDDAKSMLWGLVGTVEMNLELGRDPLTDVEPYFIIEGPAGCGKTTMARLIVKLFSALDIIPSDEVVETTGGKMVGAYVGNSSALAVQSYCEKAWGKGLFVDEVVGMTTSGDFSLQAAKELLTQTLNNKGKFVMVVADYSVNIDRFLAMDQGISRRFANRLRLEAMGGDGAAKMLRRVLDARGLDCSAIESLMPSQMSELAGLAAWASGGDVMNLDNKIWRIQVAAKQKSRMAGEDFDLKKLSAEVFDAAFEELKRDIRTRPDPNRASSASGQAFAYASQTQTASASASASTDDIELTAEDHSALSSMADIDVQFGNRLSDAEELKRQEEDPNSEYNQALAKKLGLSSAEAKAVRVAVKMKVKRLVEVMEPKQLQKFVYHCPFCGRVNSPACAYFNYPLDWKVAHSTKKPWMETTYERKHIEQVVEETVNGRPVLEWN